MTFLSKCGSLLHVVNVAWVVFSRLAKRHSQHFKNLCTFITLNLIQLLWSIFSNSKKSKSDYAFYLSKTNWQLKTADIVNIYNRPVYQHNRKNKMRKSNICKTGFTQQAFCSETSSVFWEFVPKRLWTIFLWKQGYHMKYFCKRCVLVLQLQFICFFLTWLECDHIFYCITKKF